MSRDQLIADLRNAIDSVGAEPSRQGEARKRKRTVTAPSKNAPNGPESASNDASQALKKIVDLVNVSDRSELSVRERLSQCGFEEAAIEEAVSRAKDYGFIDDMRFAEVLIRSRIAQCKGSAGIERELAKNGIDPSSIEGWPYEYEVDDEVELDQALSFLDRKPPKSKNLREGAFRKLVQRGFPISVASTAARMWTERTTGT